MSPVARAKAALAANLALNSATGLGSDRRALAWLRRAAQDGRLVASRTFSGDQIIEWFWVPSAGLIPSERDLKDAGVAS